MQLLSFSGVLSFIHSKVSNQSLVGGLDVAPVKNYWRRRGITNPIIIFWKTKRKKK
jgi:hypothetical protein